MLYEMCLSNFKRHFLVKKYPLDEPLHEKTTNLTKKITSTKCIKNLKNVWLVYDHHVVKPL